VQKHPVLLTSNSKQSHSQQDEFFFAGVNEQLNTTINGDAIIEHKGTL